MSEGDLFLIAEIPGFTPQIGRLVSMMNYARSTTLSAVAGLGVDELDYLHTRRAILSARSSRTSLRRKLAIRPRPSMAVV